jgi:tRNA-2-methylthio-N6-dimethylallyladenosine synthase
MPTYNIWTIGCQMNKAESSQISDHLEKSGYTFTPEFQKADLIVLNTCVVRQSAEDKMLGMLSYLKGVKTSNPNASIIVTGCFVDSKRDELAARFPYVDLFFGPGVFQELVQWTERRKLASFEREDEDHNKDKKAVSPAAYVPIIQGCNNFCSYCIVPHRRGRERSRPVDEIVREIVQLVENGVKEVTLLGQNVNSYGQDLESKSDLSNLLTELNGVKGLARIRFLTNHPKDMSERLIRSMDCLDKVCEHITLPLQSGDDTILKAMRRGYSVKYYSELIERTRKSVPEIALSTDIIVGFPGETDEQFDQTVEVLKKIRFDAVHIAQYSPREGTLAFKEFKDDIPSEIKKQRFDRLETMQTQISGEINLPYQGKTVEVLVEGKKKGKWYGRTRSDKLVFFSAAGDHLGQLVDITINKTSPWALQGDIKNE